MKRWFLQQAHWNFERHKEFCNSVCGNEEPSTKPLRLTKPRHPSQGSGIALWWWWWMPSLEDDSSFKFWRMQTSCRGKVMNPGTRLSLEWLWSKIVWFSTSWCLEHWNSWTIILKLLKSYLMKVHALLPRHFGLWVKLLTWKILRRHVFELAYSCADIINTRNISVRKKSQSHKET